MESEKGRVVDARGGLVVDFGCGNGWHLRALALRCGSLRGLGLDGFDENVAQATRLARAEGFADRPGFASGDAHTFSLEAPALIAMNRARRHVWEAGGPAFIRRLRNSLRPVCAAVVWEPDWPADRAALRAPARNGLLFENLSEQGQGNHRRALKKSPKPLPPKASQGQEVVIVARRSA